MKRLEITPEIIQMLLKYEPETGKLFWKQRGIRWFKTVRDCNAWNTRYSGKEAFTTSRNGYRTGTLFGFIFYAHRIAYAAHHCAWPEPYIDHINGIRDDNRISNLRVVSHKQNSKNTALNSKNTSGRVGVYWAKSCNKWLAQITVNNRQVFLGHFENKCNAISARAEAELKYGFHENHGRHPELVA